MKSIVEVREEAREALGDGAFPADLVDVIAYALDRPSPVDAIVGTFQALRARDDLSAAALIVRRACAEQIAANGFHGLAAEAAPYVA